MGGDHAEGPKRAFIICRDWGSFGEDDFEKEKWTFKKRRGKRIHLDTTCI